MSDQYKSRTATLELVKAAGFEPDPYRWRAKWGEVTPDPFSFIKEAEFGGYWRISLDYKDKSYGYSSQQYDGRLREVQIYYTGPDTEPVKGDDDRERLAAREIEKLTTPSKNDSDIGLWFAVPGKSLREKFHNLLKDIELSLWVGFELDHLAEVKRKADNDAWYAKRKAQNAPLAGVALGDGDHEYGSPFSRLAQRAVSAARTLDNADGTTDVVQAVYDLTKALDSIVDALTDDAALLLTDKLLGLEDAHAPKSVAL